jgi:hypothetical protein
MIFDVGVLFDYFAADSDERAAATIDLPGGRSGAMPFSPELRTAMRTGDIETIQRLMRPRVRVSEHGLHALSVKGIDPVVQLGNLEEILTGAGFDEVLARPRAGMTVAVRDEGEQLVVTITDELQRALTDLVPERLAAVAVPWAQTEEFRGSGDPGVLANFLEELAGLAVRATEQRQRLYCWICG